MDLAHASFAFIEGLGGPEMVLIFVVVLMLFGGQKLPEFARGLGKTIREFKKAAAGVEEEFKRALDDDERKKLAAAAPAAAVATTPESGTGTSDSGHDYNDPYADNYGDGSTSSETDAPGPVTTDTTPPGAEADTGDRAETEAKDVSKFVSSESTTGEDASSGYDHSSADPVETATASKTAPSAEEPAGDTEKRKLAAASEEPPAAAGDPSQPAAPAPPAPAPSHPA
jgi:TatA/E family protein of Tat protein translocase